MKKTVIYCDLCGQENKKMVSLEMPVFDGFDGLERIYLQKHSIDICNECIVSLIRDIPIIKDICNHDKK
jgi:hypothetical protein